MSEAIALNAVDYVQRLNSLRRLAAAAISDGEPFVYLTIRKPVIPTTWRVHLGDHRGPIGEVTQITPVNGWAAVSLRLKPCAVLLWCQQEAERLAS